MKVTVSFDASNVASINDAKQLVSAIAERFNGESVGYATDEGNQDDTDEGSFLTRNPWGRTRTRYATLSNITFVSAEDTVTVS